MPNNPPPSIKRKQDPESLQLGCLPYDFRQNDVAVDLLQDNDEDNEPKSLKGIYDKNNDGAGNGADKRPEKRNDICNADDYGD